MVHNTSYSLLINQIVRIRKYIKWELVIFNCYYYHSTRIISILEFKKKTIS